MKSKALTAEIDTGELPIHEVVQLHHRMFVSRNYDWWRETKENDIVVDVGAGIGAFSAKALDSGAKKVYMIEPSKSLLKTAIKNVTEYIINREEPVVVPVWAALGKTDIDLGNVFGCKRQPAGAPEPELLTFKAFREKFSIGEIDFLKVTAEGAEFNILTEQDVEFCATQVRHMAVLVHMTAQYGAALKFAKWRDTFLKPFVELGRVRFQDASIKEKMFQDNYKEVLPDKFMIYITNW